MAHRLVLAAFVTTLFTIAGCVSSTREQASSRPASQPSRRPNIVLILADDLGWGDVGYHGSEIKTPHLDRLAAAGVRLDRFYAFPVCSPSRAALMTGRHPFRMGFAAGNVRGSLDAGLPVGERTLAAALKSAGYRTVICGKWHLGHTKAEYLPHRRGFDLHYGNRYGPLDYYTHKRGGRSIDWWRNDAVAVEEGYVTDLLATEAVRVIQDQPRAQPLFLYLPFTAPHTPLQSPLEWEQFNAHIDESDRRTYAGMVSCLDAAVGRIELALKQRGMWDNTLLIFCSDNGAADYRAGRNTPLRGGKRTLYEGGVRVPAFVIWPDGLRGQRVVSSVVRMVDWYPTLVRLAGGSLAQPLPLDGVDVWPTLAQDRPTVPDEFVLNITDKRSAIRRNRWKLIVHTGVAGGGRARFPRSRSQPAIELFDVQSDPGEQHDVASEHADLVESLQRRLDFYQKQVVSRRD